MMFEVYPLFPTVIAKKNLAIEFNEEELTELYTTDLFLQGLGNGASFDEHLLENPKYERLKEVCLRYAQDYFTDVMKYRYPLHITNSWLNVTQENQEHMMHNHTNSMVSGILYLKTMGSVPSIMFTSNTPTFMLNLQRDEANMLNSMVWELPVEDNCIVLFPSQCFHSVKRNLSSNERISIAFNTFIKGKVDNAPCGGNLDLG